MFWSYNLEFHFNLSSLFDEFLSKWNKYDSYNKASVITLFLKWFYKLSLFFKARNLLVRIIQNVSLSIKKKNEPYLLLRKKIQIVWDAVFFEYSLGNYKEVLFLLTTLKGFCFFYPHDENLVKFSCLYSKTLGNINPRQGEIQAVANSVLAGTNIKKGCWKWNLTMHLQKQPFFPVLDGKSSSEFQNLLKRTPPCCHWLVYYSILKEGLPRWINVDVTKLFSFCIMGKSLAPSCFKFLFDICALEYLFSLAVVSSETRISLTFAYVGPAFLNTSNWDYCTEGEVLISTLVRLKTRNLLDLAIYLLKHAIQFSTLQNSKNFYVSKLFLVLARTYLGESDQIHFIRDQIGLSLFLPLSPQLSLLNKEDNIYLWTAFTFFFLNPTKKLFHVDQCCAVLHHALLWTQSGHQEKRNADLYISLLRVYYLMKKFSSLSPTSFPPFPESWFQYWFQEACMKHVNTGYYYSMFQNETPDANRCYLFQKICSYIQYDIDRFQSLYQEALLRNISKIPSPIKSTFERYRSSLMLARRKEFLVEQFQTESKFGDLYPNVPLSTKQYNSFTLLFKLKRFI